MKGTYYSRNKKMILQRGEETGIIKYVYIWRQPGTNFYKIGQTKKWEERIKVLKANNPFDPEMVHVTQVYPVLETELHFKYRNFRLQNRREWFELTGEQYYEIVNTLDAEATMLKATISTSPQASLQQSSPFPQGLPA